jgi:hypothetical protein
VTTSCERDDEPSGSIKSGKIFDKLSDYQLVKDSASRQYCSLGTILKTEVTKVAELPF